MNIEQNRAKAEAKLAEALAEVAACYADLARIALEDRDRHEVARMVRRELEAANRARFAELGNNYRY